MNKALTIRQIVMGRLRDYAQLAKVTLSLWVVFSALFGFVFAKGQASFFNFLYLALGGFLITGASNTLNQIFEVETDRLMKRTANRPLPTGRIQIMEALLWAGVQTVCGTILLWFKFNGMAAFLGLLSLVSYAMIYTPMKRVGSIAVFVGAIPGALPPMIGAVAATGGLSVEAVWLFVFQFVWQFPHFWAIGWVGFNDYKKAGFHLLPSYIGRDSITAINAIVYCVILLVVSVLPMVMNMQYAITTFIIVLLGLGFTYYAIQLLFNQNDKMAKALMFASIAYLPLVQILYIIGRQ